MRNVICVLENLGFGPELCIRPLLAGELNNLNTAVRVNRKMQRWINLEVIDGCNSSPSSTLLKSYEDSVSTLSETRHNVNSDTTQVSDLIW
jgi:hypothetical protein